MNLTLRRACYLIVLAISLACSGPAQSFVFVSPNTRMQMPDHAARASQDSFEQQNFLAVARFLGERLCRTPHVESALGLDGPGSENSVLLTGCKQAESAYLGALLARYAHQKWLLIFDPAGSGRERLFEITAPSRDPEDVLQQMRRLGLNEGTILARDNQVIVYIRVKEESLDERIHTLAEANHGDIRETQGMGVAIGDDDRGKAQRVFDRRILAYERKHRIAYSSLLWSKKLRDLGPVAVNPPEKRPSLAEELPWVVVRPVTGLGRLHNAAVADRLLARVISFRIVEESCYSLLSAWSSNAASLKNRAASSGGVGLM